MKHGLVGPESRRYNHISPNSLVLFYRGGLKSGSLRP